MKRAGHTLQPFRYGLLISNLFCGINEMPLVYLLPYYRKSFNTVSYLIITQRNFRITRI